MSSPRVSLPILLLLGASIACAPEEPSASAPEAVASRDAARLPDDEARALLEALAGSSASEAREAMARIREAGDVRFAAAFVELMRAAEIDIAHPVVYQESIDALEDLTGQGFGPSWPDWVEWYAGTELEPPPGFTGWKGRLLARVDPRFGELLYDGAPARIRVEEVVWGGVAYEGIPALDDPEVLAAEEAEYLSDAEPVFGIAIGGRARAYPLRILDWHEMANDTLAGVSLSLAYCTLCGAGIAYRSRATDGRDYDFGSSGFLMRSNKLMVDRQTRSLWNQFTGRPVVGRLAARDVRLERLPVVVTTWGDWRSRHPQTTVLSLETGHQRTYTPGAAYGGYFESDRTMFPVREQSRVLPPKARIYGLEVEGRAVAYPVATLITEGVVNDRVADAGLVLVATRPAIRVSGESIRSGPVRYEAGAPVRAYRTEGDRFGPGPDADAVVDDRGRLWQVSEEALVGPDGERAPRIEGFLAYWFGWNAYYPRSRVYGLLPEGGS